jgi:hypothetical protein
MDNTQEIIEWLNSAESDNWRCSRFHRQVPLLTMTVIEDCADADCVNEFCQSTVATIGIEPAGEMVWVSVSAGH